MKLHKNSVELASLIKKKEFLWPVLTLRQQEVVSSFCSTCNFRESARQLGISSDVVRCTVIKSFCVLNSPKFGKKNIHAFLLLRVCEIFLEKIDESSKVKS